MKKINLKINKLNYMKKKKSRPPHPQSPDQIKDDNSLDYIEDLII